MRASVAARGKGPKQQGLKSAAAHRKRFLAAQLALL